MQQMYTAVEMTKKQIHPPSSRTQKAFIEEEMKYDPVIVRQPKSSESKDSTDTQSVASYVDEHHQYHPSSIDTIVPSTTSIQEEEKQNNVKQAAMESKLVQINPALIGVMKRTGQTLK